MIAPKTLLKSDLDPVWLMRIFTVIPAVLILVAAAGAIWIYFFATSLLPQGESIVEAPGLTRHVRVERDSNGIPTIVGQSEQDVALVFGYVMAQDRLWQMDYLRRAGQGRLAEILGSDYIDGDHLIRTIKAAGPGDEYPGSLGQDERRWLESFVQGINRYIAGHTTKLPVEFSLLQYKPEAFRPEDVMSICFALAWESSVAGRVDAVMARILGRLGTDRGLALFPTDPAARFPLVSADLAGWEPKGILFRRPGSRLLDRVPGFRGGCVFAIAGNRSQSGKPMAGTSVYQTLSAPGFWYRAHLVAGDFQLSGAFIPGVPVAVVGTNRAISWGCISTPADDADLFIEQLDSSTPKRYWKIDRWRDIQEVRQRYRVRRGSSVSRTVFVTETGPLVSDLIQDRALSMRWTGHQSLGFIPAILRLNRASDSAEIRTALKALVAPCLNVVWVDSSGGFGVQSAGAFPIRSAESDGIVPMPAWTEVHNWQGLLPFSALPAKACPASGILVVADERPGGLDFPYFTGSYWSEDSRASRVRRVLEENANQQRESLQRLQNDSFSQTGSGLTPKVLRAADSLPKSETERQALNALQSWDYHMTRESAGAAVFGLFYQALLEDLFRGPLGDSLYGEFTEHHSLVAAAVKKIFTGKETAWLHGADQSEILARSFQKAVARGSGLMGSDPTKWKWGDIHSTIFEHPLAARSRFLEALYQVGPIGLSGAADTVNFAAWSPANPFAVREGVTLRQIADMTAPPRLFSVNSLGSSAHFFSIQYKNQTRAWADGGAFQDVVLSAERDSPDTMVFKPQHASSISMNK